MVEYSVECVRYVLFYDSIRIRTFSVSGRGSTLGVIVKTKPDASLGALLILPTSLLTNILTPNHGYARLVLVTQYRTPARAWDQQPSQTTSTQCRIFSNQDHYSEEEI